MAKKSNREEFIAKANKKYKNKFDYSKFEYVAAKIKSIIICPIHGEFSQNPDKHLTGVYGCKRCADKGKAETKMKNGFKPHKKPAGKEVFLERANEKFGDNFEYDLSNYSGLTGDKIAIRCKKHGWFEKIPRNFLTTVHGCNKCDREHFVKVRTGDYDEFILKSKSIHRDKYLYPESNREIYINKKSIINIYCKIHKKLIPKKAQKHIAGQGCPRCAIDELVKNGILKGGYCDELFKDNPEYKDIEAYLYYIEFGEGEYFKIGITTNPKGRVSRLRNRARKSGLEGLKVLYLYETTLFNAYNMEQKILETFKESRIRLEFSTEIFNSDISVESEFKKIIESHSKDIIGGRPMKEENYIIDKLKNRLMEEEVTKQIEKILDVDFSFIPGANSRIMIIQDLVKEKNKLNEVLAVLGSDYREIFKLIIVKGDMDKRLEELRSKK